MEKMPFQRALLVLLLQLLALPATAAEDGMPPLAPDRISAPQTNTLPPAESAVPNADRSNEQVEPLPSIILPPHVPPRQLPAASVNPPGSAAEMARTAFVKPPLAWRTKAQQLRQSSTAANRRVSATYDAAIMALITLLPQFGYHVDTLNSKAGEILAAPADANSKQRVIFVLSEMPPGSVTVKAMPIIQGKQTNDTIQQILNSIATSTERRGTL